MQVDYRDRYKLEVFEKLFQGAMESKGALIVQDAKTKKVIGSTRFKDLGTGNHVEIGWTFLAKAYWGGAYNRAFKTLMIKHAFESLENVIFYIAAENFRSQKATEKLGAIKLAKEDDFSLFKGEPDYTTDRIQKTDWKKVK